MDVLPLADSQPILQGSLYHIIIILKLHVMIYKAYIIPISAYQEISCSLSQYHHSITFIIMWLFKFAYSLCTTIYTKKLCFESNQEVGGFPFKIFGTHSANYHTVADCASAHSLQCWLLVCPF